GPAAPGTEYASRMRSDELADGRPGHARELARAAAPGVGRDRGAGRRAVPAAALADVDQLVGDVDRGAGRRLVERDLHLDGDVAPLHPARAPPEAAEASEWIPPEERVEDVGEGAEAVGAR